MKKFKWFTGWVAKARKLKGTFYISIDKGVTRAVRLEKGDRLYAYRGEDENERPVMIVYLDLKNRFGEVEPDQKAQTGVRTFSSLNLLFNS